MREPSIAVVVPNRNDARYLPRCLSSILDQEVKPEELIVVDDQSTDDSVAIIRSLIVDNPRAQLVVNPLNLGTNGALNEGLRRVQSEYVLFLAANDFVLPGIFARAKACLARSPGVGLWSALAWLVDEEDRPIRLHLSPVVALKDALFTPEHCVKLAHRFGSWLTGGTIIYHRDALRTAGGFDPAYGGLSDLITALVVASQHGAAYSPEPFAAIRVHSNSFLSSTLTDVARLETMLKRLGERGPQMSPQLFGASFLDRTALRFRFAAVRASGGAAISEISARTAGWRRLALLIADRLVPAVLRTTRVALAFLILRPFDVLPTLWNRLLGCTAVWLRLRLRGRAPPS
ncbi:glycosyltransferase family 2 protein [Sulfuricaulis sp.]|uniref:glycosyltransferase family 2 protein n=1 Tax=Sulfuricaulis sp. TaxID=2003553 RepID=UPI00355AAD13